MRPLRSASRASDPPNWGNLPWPSGVEFTGSSFEAETTACRTGGIVQQQAGGFLSSGVRGPKNSKICYSKWWFNRTKSDPSLHMGFPLRLCPVLINTVNTWISCELWIWSGAAHINSFWCDGSNFGWNYFPVVYLLCTCRLTRRYRNRTAAINSRPLQFCWRGLAQTKHLKQ